VASVLRKCTGNSADEIAQAVLDGMERFSVGESPTDDVTLVILRRTASVAVEGEGCVAGHSAEESGQVLDDWLAQRGLVLPENGVKRHTICELMTAVAEDPEQGPEELHRVIQSGKPFEASTPDRKRIDSLLHALNLGDRQDRRTFAEWARGRQQRQPI
jgi:hypothetical protein